MGEHFTLAVEPDQVHACARRLGELADTVGGHGRGVQAAPEDWRSGWRSSSSTAIAEQTVALAEQLGSFETRLASAADALQGYGRTLDTALHDDLPDLNRRWRDAQVAYDDALTSARRNRDVAADNLAADLVGPARRSVLAELDQGLLSSNSTATGELNAVRERLEEEFDDLRAHLRQRSRLLANSLAAELAVPVTAAEVAAYRASQSSGWSRFLSGFFGADAASAVAARARAQTGGPLGDLHDQLNNPPRDYAEVTALLERARGLDLPPQQYAATLESYCRYRAASLAGIDLDEWDPSLGADHNQEIIEAVYRYYGDLYLQNPDLQWAGMANMIGPSFAAGFFDLSLFRRLSGSLSDLPPGVGSAVPDGVEKLSELTEEDLRYFETAFLSMQQEIFFDQGAMHQAYVDGGLEAIDELGAAGLVPPDVVDAWGDLDSGRPEQVTAANELFLYREQFDIIDDDYQRMFEHSPTGPAMTWMMTFIGAPSIPGAQGYPDVFPLTVQTETPGPDRIGTPRSIFGHEIPHVSVDNPAQGTVTVATPFPDGNIARFDDRWALIANDTLPAFQQLLADDPERARELIAADVGDRIDDYRLQHRIDDIIEQLGDWDVDLDQ